MKIDISLKGMDELRAALDPDNITKAARRAVQRATSAGKTVISEQIRQRFNIKKSDLDKKISMDLSRLNNLEGVLTVTGQPISLTYFGPSQVRGNIKTFVTKNRGIAQTKRARGGGGGVTARIIKNKTAKLRGAFIARGRGGNAQVFKRIGETRLPIRSIKVIGITSIISQPQNMIAIEERIIEQLKKEFLTPFQSSTCMHVGE